MRKKSAVGIGGILAGIAVSAGAVATYVRLVRPRMMSWGAANVETKRALPGDDLVENPKFSATHAVTIRAPAAEVWRWLVQIGQGRAGFYSYDWIENMIGADIHSTDRILPEFQGIQVGDKIPLAQGGFGVPVKILEPRRTLVLFGDTRLDPGAIPTVKAGDYFATTWGWFLDPVNASTTRLIERWRVDWNESLSNSIYMRAFLEPGAFLMSRKMLLGIKERAEGLHSF